MKRILISLVVLSLSSALIAGFFSFNETSENNSSKNAAAYTYKVVEVSGNQIKSLYGKPFSDISVYALKNEVLEPIPFQFEEFVHLGRESEKSENKKSKDILNSNDLLVFMLKDTGSKASASDLKGVDLLSTLTLEYEGITTYVYLIRNGKLSEKQYVNYDEITGVLSMPEATIHMNPKDILDWGDFIPITDGSVENKSLLDCLKIRINGRFLAFQLKLNNNNIKANLEQVFHGPVRVVMNGKLQATISNIPLLSADAQMTIDSSSALLFIDMKIPSQYSKLMKDPVVLIGVDGNNLYGKRVQTSISSDTEYMVDGKMDDDEKSLNKKKITEASSWIWLSDNAGLNLIGQYDLSANKDFDPENHPDIFIFYLDDEKFVDKPERFKGSVPTLGYRLEGIPKSDNVRMSYKVIVIQDKEFGLAKNYLDKIASDVYINEAIH